MGVVTIQPGERGADYVYLTDAMKVWLLANNVTFVLRYVVPPRTTRINKDLKPEEITWLTKHGIAIIPNWEIHHQDGLGGAPKGKIAGDWLRTWAEDHGVPTSTHLIVSVDSDTYAGNLRAHTEYVNAFKDAVRPYQFGVYGDVDIAAAVQGELFWRANAGGWGRNRPDVPVHIQQHRALYPPGVDPNTCIRPFKAWRPGTSSSPPKGRLGMALTTFDPKQRILDTILGTNTGRRRLKAGEILDCGVPAGMDGKAAHTVIVIVHVINPTTDGHVKVVGNRFGSTSDGDYEAGNRTTACPTIAAVDEHGQVHMSISHGEADIIVDLLGVVT